MGIEAKLHTIGIPIRLHSIPVDEEIITMLTKWVESGLRSPSAPRIIQHKEYDAMAERLIVNLARACINLNVKCSIVTGLPLDIVAGTVYIFPSYEDQFNKIIKRITYSALALVIYDNNLSISKDFIITI